MEIDNRPVACYSRVSTDDKQQTTDNQIILLNDYCRKRGWTPEHYEDHASATKSRPMKQEIMQLCRQRKFKAVVVVRLDRLARSQKELLDTVTEWKSLGVDFVSISDGIDFTTPVGKLQFGVLSAVAEFEHSLIKKRVKEGMARAKKQGKHVGRQYGAKDKKRRKRAGYNLRWIKERKNKKELDKKMSEQGSYLDRISGPPSKADYFG